MSPPIGLMAVGATAAVFVIWALAVPPAYYRSEHEVCAHFCYESSEHCASPEIWADVSCITGVVNECGKTGQSPIDLSITDATTTCVDYQADGTVETQFNVSYYHGTSVSSAPSYVSFSNHQINPVLTLCFFSFIRECPLNGEFPSEGLPSVTLGHDENASTLWTLVQFHFHDGSEHTIDGNRFDSELHLVHQSTEGKVMVIGILMNENGNGDDNNGGDSYDVSETMEPLLQVYEAAAANVVDACSSGSAVGEDANVVPHEVLGISDVPDGWSPYDMLPDADAFTVGSFAYMGSLTTPPCTTGVKWLVLDTPMSISAEQSSRLKDLIGGAASPYWPSCSSEIPVDYYGTYRPTQSAGFRDIVHFCDV